MEQKNNHTGFLGTYFNKDGVIRISRSARVLAWVVLGVYGLQFGLTIVLTLIQIVQGSWAGMRFIDMVQNVLYIFTQVLTGGLYFFILMGIAQFLLILLDVEDNTRKAARQ